jgi:hypothetical protein
MAAAQTYAQWKSVFERLFANPSIEEMLPPHLEWPNFEQFIRYVFDCAGYAAVHVAEQKYPDPVGMGFDLNLHAQHPNGRILARVEVRQFKPGHPLDLNSVMAFIGKLAVAKAHQGFMVTTSDFTGPAYTAAEATGGKVQLINGKTLLRYITYVGGSRTDGTFAGQTVAPPDPIPPTVLRDADAIMTATARPPRTPMCWRSSTQKAVLPRPRLRSTSRSPWLPLTFTISVCLSIAGRKCTVAVTKSPAIVHR